MHLFFVRCIRDRFVTEQDAAFGQVLTLSAKFQKTNSENRTFAFNRALEREHENNRMKEHFSCDCCFTAARIDCLSKLAGSKPFQGYTLYRTRFCFFTYINLSDHLITEKEEDHV